MIKVMLVDDQNLVRKGVRSLLELSDEIEVVAEAADGAEAIRMVPEVAPDVVLLDMSVSDGSSDVMRMIHRDRRYQDLPIVIISSPTHHDAAMLHFAQWWQRAIRSGHGFAQVGDLHARHFGA